MPRNFADTEIEIIELDFKEPRQWFFRYRGTDYGLFLRLEPVPGEADSVMPARFFLIPGKADSSRAQKVSCCSAPYRPTGLLAYNIAEKEVAEICLDDLGESDNCFIQLCPLVYHKSKIP